MQFWGKSDDLPQKSEINIFFLILFPMKLSLHTEENYLRKTFFVLVLFSIIRALCTIRNLPIYDRQISGSGINSLHAGFMNRSCSPIWFNFSSNKKFS